MGSEYDGDGNLLGEPGEESEAAYWAWQDAIGAAMERYGEQQEEGWSYFDEALSYALRTVGHLPAAAVHAASWLAAYGEQWPWRYRRAGERDHIVAAAVMERIRKPWDQTVQ